MEIRIKLEQSEIESNIIAINITLSVVRELLDRYDKANANYNALCQLSTNLIKLKSTFKRWIVKD